MLERAGCSSRKENKTHSPAKHSNDGAVRPGNTLKTTQFHALPHFTFLWLQSHHQRLQVEEFTTESLLAPSRKRKREDGRSDYTFSLQGNRYLEFQVRTNFSTVIRLYIIANILQCI